MRSHGEGAKVCAEGGALVCREGRWLAVPCRGPGGCKESGRCDQDLAQEGDPCLETSASASEDHACSTDRKTTLTCREGRFVAGRPCRGPKGCSSATVKCDQTVAESGDACDKGSASFGACSVDGRSLLKCEDAKPDPPGQARGRFTLSRECPTRGGCKMGRLAMFPDTQAPTCDFAGAEVGAPCGKGNEHLEVCSADGKTVLSCEPTALTFVTRRECPTGAKCKTTESGAECGP